MKLPLWCSATEGVYPMTYHQEIAAIFGSDPAQVCTFLDDHGSALARAAHMLGGPGASARVFLMSEAVRHARRLTRAQRRQLIDLHRLLTLQNVGDPDRIECACNAEIDPDSPFVDECCLLAEGLEVLLRQISEYDPVGGTGCKGAPIGGPIRIFRAGSPLVGGSPVAAARHRATWGNAPPARGARTRPHVRLSSYEWSIRQIRYSARNAIARAVGPGHRHRPKLLPVPEGEADRPSICHRCQTSI